MLQTSFSLHYKEELQSEVAEAKHCRRIYLILVYMREGKDKIKEYEKEDNEQQVRQCETPSFAANKCIASAVLFTYTP